MNNKVRVLIVEDDDAIRSAVVTRCKHDGFEVFEAEDGEDGVRMTIELRPDIVVMDIVMPKMDGLEALEKIRAEGEFGESLPVIVFTNMMPDEQLMKEMAKTSPTHYLLKNDTALDEITEKIRACVNR